MYTTSIAAIFGGNPANRPVARNRATAVARILCAALADTESHRGLALCIVSESSSVIPKETLKVVALLEQAIYEILPGCSLGSGRQYAADQGGHIVAAYRKEAVRRFKETEAAQWGEVTKLRGIPMTVRDAGDVVEGALRALYPNIVPAFEAIELLRDSVENEAPNAYAMAQAAVILAITASGEFVIDHTAGQVARVVRKATEKWLLTPADKIRVDGRYFYAAIPRYDGQCNRISLAHLIWERRAQIRDLRAANEEAQS